MSSPSQYVFPSSDAVAFHQDSWDAPALTYSGASSPASSASSPSSTPGSPESGSQQHIPRPRNAFIIFRSFFYIKTREAQNESNINQNALSCAAAAAWKELPEDRKKTFRKQAEDEKLMHYKKHPNYVYTPLNRAVKRAQKKASNKTASKRPAKKHRSSLSQRSRKAESLRSKSRRSTTDDSLRDNSASGDDIQDEECCDDAKTDGESQKRVDVQFGQRPDVTFTQLPPTPTDDSPGVEPTSPTTLSTSSDIPLCHNPGYPDWMYKELLGYGAPDTGLHAGWNPLQTTLNSYGDNYNTDDFSRYVNYDNVDTTASDYSVRETTGADAAFSFPSLDYDGNWVGV